MSAILALLGAKGMAVLSGIIAALAGLAGIFLAGKRSQKAAHEIGAVASSSVALAEQAGVLFSQLVPDIQHTSDLIQEITCASQEQTVGVNQINLAMNQLSQITQQSASAAEVLADTAKAVNGRAGQLTDLISCFRLK